MALNIGSLLNKSALVACPSLFGDAEARACRVVAAEAFGVWLVSEELSARVLPRAQRERGKSIAAQPIFVPFAQIGAIVPLAPTASATTGMKPASAASAQSPATATVRAANVRTNPTAQTNASKTSGPTGA